MFNICSPPLKIKIVFGAFMFKSIGKSYIIQFREFKFNHSGNVCLSANSYATFAETCRKIQSYSVVVFFQKLRDFAMASDWDAIPDFFERIRYVFLYNFHKQMRICVFAIYPILFETTLWETFLWFTEVSKFFI